METLEVRIASCPIECFNQIILQLFLDDLGMLEFIQEHYLYIGEQKVSNCSQRAREKKDNFIERAFKEN